MELNGKKVLITGAQGFIGSHLVEELLARKCRLKAFVSYSSSNSWGWLDSLPRDEKDKLDIFLGDIRDPNGVREAMKGVDVVFHLAALIGIPFSYHSPDSYVDTNIKGTLNILQAAKDNKVSRILVTSTSEVYGTAQYVPIDEEHPKQPQSPYSATKIGADAMAVSFHRSFDLPVTIVRPFNTYGPRQSARAIIPTVITQLLSGAKELKLGALHPTRDLVYVEDTVNGFIEIACSKKAIGEEINIATGEEISIADVVTKIKTIVRSDASIREDRLRMRSLKASGNERLRGANTKIKKLTAWKPRFGLDEGLAKTVEWFRDPANIKSYKANVYNI